MPEEFINNSSEQPTPPTENESAITQSPTNPTSNDPPSNGTPTTTPNDRPAGINQHPRFREVYGEKKELERKVSDLESKLSDLTTQISNSSAEAKKAHYLEQITKAMDEGDNQTAARLNLEYQEFLISNQQNKQPKTTEQRPESNVGGDEYQRAFYAKYQSQWNDPKFSEILNQTNADLVAQFNGDPNMTQERFMGILDYEIGKKIQAINSQVLNANNVGGFGRVQNSPVSNSQSFNLSKGKEALAAQLVTEGRAKDITEARKIMAEEE